MKKSVPVKVKNIKLSTAGGILPLVAAILFIFSPADVHGWDPFKIGKAAKHVHLAISELNATVNKLPDQLKDTIGSNIKLLSRDMDQMVSKIDNQTVPLLNASMATQLNHMADLTNALTSHLNEILKKTSDADRSRYGGPIESIAIHGARHVKSGPGDDSGRY
jgi:hypothetical protein